MGARWEKAIRAFEEADQELPPPKGAVLFVGSSTIRRWTTLARDFPEHDVINRGFGGACIADCTEFADRIIFPYQPSTIVFRAGGDDLKAGLSPDEVFADFRAFVAKVRSKRPETLIVFISLRLTPKRQELEAETKALNALIAAYVQGAPRMRYVDIYDLVLDASGEFRPELFAEDNLHFSPEGYRLLAEVVLPYLPLPARAAALASDAK
jgi:lysophospholipase L1-like esterase